MLALKQEKAEKEKRLLQERAERESREQQLAQQLQELASQSESQVQALSGVSIDEESINMLTYQRQFQAAAKYISTIDETLKTLLAMV